MIRTRLCTLGALTALALTLHGCADLIGATGPDITSVTITPDSIAENSTGMTDEFFSVTIETSGFEFPLEGAEVRIVDLDRVGSTNPPPTINGDQIIVNDILQSWFQGVPPGEYNIQVTVFSEDQAESVTRDDLATVTVTE